MVVKALGVIALGLLSLAIAGVVGGLVSDIGTRLELGMVRAEFIMQGRELDRCRIQRRDAREALHPTRNYKELYQDTR